MRVAVVGSGPSGFYAAGHVLKADGSAEVHLFERLPTPWGLVRGGVAPDHPKIKSVSRIYEKTAADPRLRFFGNVEVGRDVTHAELASWYDAVVYAVGTAGARPLGIPGEQLAGSHSATEFVGWYNGHPDHRELEVDLQRAQRAVVVGNGNVAIDVARMLCLGRDDLGRTDIADHALDVLGPGTVNEVVVLGRRGPEQAAFTTPELLELGELADVDVVVDPRELELADEVPEPGLDAAAQRRMEILHEYAQRPARWCAKRIVLRFCTSPSRLVGDGHVTGVELMRNELRRGPDGHVRAVATGVAETVEAQIVLVAVGYRGRRLPGLPFDEQRGLVPHDGHGRVTGADGRPLPGAYVAGWIKRGPSGVIGTNKKCAQETVDALLADAAAGRLPAPRENGGIEPLLARRVDPLVTYAGWEAIDALERDTGAAQGRPRVKLSTREELLAVAAGEAANHYDDC
jgi:ferredoxin--NADP+ reductase